MHYFLQRTEVYSEIILTKFMIDTLRKTEVTGNKDIDGIQRGVTDAIGNQFAEGRIGESVGNAIDKGLLRGNV